MHTVRKGAAIAALAATTMGFLATNSAFADAVDGKALFESKCAICHGADGTAKEMWAKKGMGNMNDPEWQKKNTDAAIKAAITDGIADKKMPAYKDKLKPEEIDALVKAVRGLKK
jgi:mono/diheme cytochrome c family protein